MQQLLIQLFIDPLVYLLKILMNQFSLLAKVSLLRRFSEANKKNDQTRR